MMNVLYSKELVNFPEWAIGMSRVSAVFTSYSNDIGETSIYAKNITHWFEKAKTGYIINVLASVEIYDNTPEVPTLLNVDLIILNKNKFTRVIKDKE